MHEPTSNHRTRRWTLHSIEAQPRSCTAQPPSPPHKPEADACTALEHSTLTHTQQPNYAISSAALLTTAISATTRPSRAVSFAAFPTGRPGRPPADDDEEDSVALSGLVTDAAAVDGAAAGLDSAELPAAVLGLTGAVGAVDDSAGGVAEETMTAAEEPTDERATTGEDAAELTEGRTVEDDPAALTAEGRADAAEDAAEDAAVGCSSDVN